MSDERPRDYAIVDRDGNLTPVRRLGFRRYNANDGCPICGMQECYGHEPPPPVPAAPEAGEPEPTAPTGLYAAARILEAGWRKEGLFVCADPIRELRERAERAEENLACILYAYRPQGNDALALAVMVAARACPDVDAKVRAARQTAPPDRKEL